MVHLEHKKSSSKIRAKVALLCISDSQTPDTDRSGRIIKAILESKRHLISRHTIVKNNEKSISDAIGDVVMRQDVDAVVTIGGTGLSRKDMTIDVVSKFYEKELKGFGELFRYLSFRKIGSSAMMSRASAGLVKGKMIFSIPGSPSAVELAGEALIAPELSHIISEVSK